MRKIYFGDDNLIRTEEGCGFRPIKACPVQSWAMRLGATCDKGGLPWAPIIHIWCKDDENNRKTVQEICDNCAYGTGHFIQKRTAKAL